MVDSSGGSGATAIVAFSSAFRVQIPPATRSVSSAEVASSRNEMADLQDARAMLPHAAAGRLTTGLPWSPMLCHGLYRSGMMNPICWVI